MAITGGAEKAIESQRRIVNAAKQQVESKGILGLRVQDVARNAGVSVPLIYKYFGDRDGLLAEVLSQMFVDCTVRNLEKASLTSVARDNGMPVNQVVGGMVPARSENTVQERALAVQMLAASVEIPSLAERLAETQRGVHQRVHAILNDLFSSHDLNDDAPIAALALLMQATSLGLIYNDLLGDHAVAEEDVAQLMQMLATAIVEGHTKKA